ncbi:hypothetical protein TTHERM_000029998 (macronuclear) [Tetrahymena thermophila SB210]|uniref:Uncharacterized protein n=1 Tax=Tetrahymena thermophila (strain SB210) TaxID=312017 RepID=W7X645_TETTS|nr:hypothetical protein TTHERM_000029998 [Tetrahymena thermophila SB210]EWS74840.1 hypothetical protein TTHERM_000029998 [Tetrahymena thermophila SB210]|eukprot:XP_012652553.1 hypothetical protein TTHERM_000029998 [Tetrahymena thermophila SB210]
MLCYCYCCYYYYCSLNEQTLTRIIQFLESIQYSIYLSSDLAVTFHLSDLIESGRQVLSYQYRITIIKGATTKKMQSTLLSEQNTFNKIRIQVTRIPTENSKAKIKRKLKRIFFFLDQNPSAVSSNQNTYQHYSHLQISFPSTFLHLMIKSLKKHMLWMF